MLQKTKRNLICSTIILLSSNIWALSAPPNVGITGSYTLGANETRSIPRIEFQLSLDCTATTENEMCQVIKIENHTSSSWTLNGAVMTGTDVQFCPGTNYKIETQGPSQLIVHNPGNNWVKLTCST